jgi:hypothetical protein
MAPPEYGVSLSETEAMSPNPEYIDIVELVDCRRLWDFETNLDWIVFIGGVPANPALGGAGGGGGELELVDAGLWTVEAVVKVDCVELAVDVAELVVGCTELDVDETGLEVDWIEVEVDEAELEVEVDDELWVSVAELAAGLTFM